MGAVAEAGKMYRVIPRPATVETAASHSWGPYAGGSDSYPKSTCIYIET